MSQLDQPRSHCIADRTGPGRALIFALTVSLLCAVGLAGAGVATAGPEVGEGAPEFSLSGSDGETYTLSGLIAGGERGVVLAWFPKAFTPG